SLWQMNGNHQLAIIEAGVSRSGEMEALHRMMQPYLTVLTTIGPAHNEGFISQEAKIREKLQLFRGADLAVYSPQDTQGVSVPTRGTHVTWGGAEATLNPLGYEVIAAHHCIIRAEYKGIDVA